MCIIIIKPAGAEMPAKDILRRCESRNHDGYGFATKKGVFKTLDRDEFEAALGQVSPEEPCIIHCRWATHGSVKTANCHPFRDEKSGVSFAHNGILPIRPKGDMTDSETAFNQYIRPVLRKHDLRSDEVRDAVNNIVGSSRFAFIDKDGKIDFYGQFYKIGDCLYSNLNIF